MNKRIKLDREQSEKYLFQMSSFYFTFLDEFGIKEFNVIDDILFGPAHIPIVFCGKEFPKHLQ